MQPVWVDDEGVTHRASPQHLSEHPSHRVCKGPEPLLSRLDKAANMVAVQANDTIWIHVGCGRIARTLSGPRYQWCPVWDHLTCPKCKALPPTWVPLTLVRNKGNPKGARYKKPRVPATPKPATTVYTMALQAVSVPERLSVRAPRKRFQPDPDDSVDLTDQYEPRPRRRARQRVRGICPR